MELDIFNPSRHIRRAVLFWLSLLLSCAFFVASYLDYTITDCLPTAMTNASFALFSLFVSSQTYRKDCSNNLALLYSGAMVMLVLFGILRHTIYHGLYLWASIFPIMFYIFVEKRQSFILCLIGFAAVTGGVIFKMYQHQGEIHAYLLINFIMSYICIWVTAHILEVKRKSSETSLGQLASRDALTGVYNRHALAHNFHRYRQESKKLPMSLLVLDLDYFKQVNDMHGHDVGDKVLIQTAALIDAFSDEHLVYRIGGEEFCIALHNADITQAMVKAEHIRLAIENYRFNQQDCPISLTASIGVYQCDHFNDLESVLRKADIELYKAKKNGRNQVMIGSEQELELASS